jgi:hypothetical protein
MIKSLASGVKRIVARSRIGLLKDPAISGSRIVWADSRSGAGYLRIGWVQAGRGIGTVETLRTRTRAYWTTSLASGVVYSTRWTLATGVAQIYRTDF